MNDVPVTLLSRKAIFKTRAVEVSVEISDREQLIQTLEGLISCHPGDAIVTGTEGERWPVQANKFQEKYMPIKGQQAGIDGRYIKRINQVDAAQLHEPLKINLSNERGMLTGVPGDWCVWYSENDMSIVAKDIFPKLYESDNVSVYVQLGKDLSAEDKISALGVVHELDLALTNTIVAFTEETSDTHLDQPIWFRIVKNVPNLKHIIPSDIEISLDSINRSNKENLVVLVKLALLQESKWAYSFRKLFQTLKFWQESKHDSLGNIVAAQLAAVDSFNAKLNDNLDRKFTDSFIPNRSEDTEPAGLKKICQIGDVADNLATIYQTKWQKLVFSTTKEIATAPMIKQHISTLISLVVLGVFAAIFMAAFSELGDKCEMTDPLSFKFCTSDNWENFSGLFFILLYLVALGVAWYRYAAAKTEQWEARHQDYRLLAESIRVLHVRSILGNPTCVARDLPLSEPTDSGWVQLALRSIFFDAQRSGMQTTLDDPAKISLAMKSFIGPQVEYHENTLLIRREKAIQRLNKAASVGFIIFKVTIIVLTVHVFVLGLFNLELLSKMGKHYILIFLVFGLGSWAGTQSILDSFGLEQELKRGRLVLSQLAEAAKIGSNEAILKAANYFLNDQAQWHSLHRNNPIEAVTGG